MDNYGTIYAYNKHIWSDKLFLVECVIYIFFSAHLQIFKFGSSLQYNSDKRSVNQEWPGN